MKNKISGGFHRMVHFLVRYFSSPDIPSFGRVRIVPLWKSCLQDTAYFLWTVILPLIGLATVCFIAIGKF